MVRDRYYTTVSGRYVTGEHNYLPYESHVSELLSTEHLKLVVTGLRYAVVIVPVQ